MLQLLDGQRRFAWRVANKNRAARSKPAVPMIIAPRSTPVFGITGTGAGGDGGVESIGRITLRRIDDVTDEENEEENEEDEMELLLNELEMLEDDNEELDKLDTLLPLADALVLDDATAVQSVMVTVSTVTVPPNAKALPFQVLLAPTVIPALSMTVPAKAVLAASVTACVGVQKTSHDDAPINETIAPAVDVNAPPDLKIYVPLPRRESGPPIFIAPELQYTPGVYTPTGPCVTSVERLIAPAGNENVHGCDVNDERAMFWSNPAVT